MTTIADATALFQAGRHADAAEACRTILSTDLENQDALRLLGRCLVGLGQKAQGVAMLAAAVGDDVPALVELSTRLREIGLAAEAETRARTALRLSPGSTEARSALGLALLAQGRTTEADEALETGPDPSARTAQAFLLLARGNEHLIADRLEDAAAAYRAALILDPAFTPALGNLGNVLAAQSRISESLESYRTALRLTPDDNDIGFAYALALLLAGEFAEAWRWHECRRQVAGLRWNFERHPELPAWQDGTDLTGKRILVTGEQGRGDMIQFARFIPALAERAGGVVLELPGTLHGLFEEMPGVTRLIDQNVPAPDCDLSCPIASLPRALGVAMDDLPGPIPYVTVRDDLRARWAAWCGYPDGRQRIGLVVSGESRHPHDARRSIPLARFADVLSLPHQFILVQTELRATDRDAREMFDGLRFLGAALTDFADTAALLSELDLLVTVDTATAHLAGALGRPVWLLLAHAADARWMLGRSDTPWYPTMRLLRQDRPGDWDSVLARVKADLAALPG